MGVKASSSATHYVENLNREPLRFGDGWALTDTLNVARTGTGHRATPSDTRHPDLPLFLVGQRVAFCLSAPVRPLTLRPAHHGARL